MYRVIEYSNGEGEQFFMNKEKEEERKSEMAECEIFGYMKAIVDISVRLLDYLDVDTIHEVTGISIGQIKAIVG